MTDFLAAALVLLLIGVLGVRVVVDAERPKVVLVRAEWSCRRSHPEFDVRPVPAPDGGTDHTVEAVMVCDSWSRR